VRVLAFALLLVLAYIFGIVLAARISLHPPRIPLFSSPGAFGAPQEDIVMEPAEAIVCPGWWVQAENPRAIAILAHGYAMNRAELAPQAYQLWRSGVSCLLFDFRAHGRSRGGCSTIGWRERQEVAAAVALAKERQPGVPLVLIGSSMGSAACAFALATNPELANGLVLDSSYSRLSNSVPGWWRFVGGMPLQVLLWPVLPVAALLAKIQPHKIDVAEALEKIHIPVLVLHGDKDDLATPSEAERNLAALPEDTKAVWFAGCGHTEGRWLQPEVYWNSVDSFIAQLVSQQPKV
jgi:pimeloyl-ACP methyl ester carboxylesterase